MKIDLVDLKVQYKSIKKEIDLAIKKAINDSDFILGKELKLFEEEIAKYFNVNFAVGVASGTDALFLSLRALDIKDNDEVITTPFTFIATSESIVRVKAKPVFVDIDYDTFNISSKEIEKKITNKTKAILLVHLFGMPCEMNRILEIARKYNLKVIEDCAQSFGSEYKNKKTGTFGDAGCLSFFPSKNLGCFGDGGIVITNNKDVYEKIRILRNHGSIDKYYYKMHGVNSRLDTIQAAILRVKLKYIDKWIEKRIELAKYYNKLLDNKENIITPKIPSYVKHSFNYYTIRVKKHRDFIKDYLKKNGVSCGVYYPLCLHLQDVYKFLGYKPSDFPVAEEAQREVLSLPIYPELSKIKIRIIKNLIEEGLRKI